MSSRREYGVEQKAEITAAILDLQRAHTRYLSILPLFDQYIVWRYTIGSGAINAYLIFGSILPTNATNAIYWVYQFFDYYNYDIREIRAQKWIKFINFFKNPQSFTTHPDKLNIANEVIVTYIRELQSIIYRAGGPEGNIQVYKVSSEYPGLPSKTAQLFEPAIVKQLPFNSTTYDLSFNFAPFTSEESDCCFYNITIPKGSPCLLIGPPFHAYPFESEILLPPGISFDIKSRQDIILDYIPKTNKLFEQIQQKPYHIGQVFEEVSYGKAAVKKKRMNLFNAVLVK